MAHTFVKDIMKKYVVSIDSAMTVKDAATMMDDAIAEPTLPLPIIEIR